MHFFKCNIIECHAVVLCFSATLVIYELAKDPPVRKVEPVGGEGGR